MTRIPGAPLVGRKDFCLYSDPFGLYIFLFHSGSALLWPYESVDLAAKCYVGSICGCQTYSYCSFFGSYCLFTICPFWMSFLNVPHSANMYLWILQYSLNFCVILMDRTHFWVPKSAVDLSGRLSLCQRNVGCLSDFCRPIGDFFSNSVTLCYFSISLLYIVAHFNSLAPSTSASNMNTWLSWSNGRFNTSISEKSYATCVVFRAR